MTKKLTISIPDELYERMQKWGKNFNYSEIFRKAVSLEIDKKERFHLKLEEDKSLVDIFAGGDLQTQEGQYAVGKEMGFVYAKTSPYPRIKEFERYLESWDKQDQEELGQFHYDLDIWSIVESLGEVEELGDIEDIPNDAIHLSGDFDSGFMAGIIEFIKEECSDVEVSKLVLERDKEMLLAKDEDEKWKIFKDYGERMQTVMGNDNG